MPAPFSLEDKVDRLRRPDAYDPPVAHVTALETHMSWVFLAGDRAYKLKKPVRFAYLDFSTLARRERACRQEYLLNHRLAPDTYLGLLPLSAGTDGLVLDGDGEVADWLVVMRRLPDGGNLETALARDALGTPDVDRIAATLAAFYRHTPRVPVAPGRHLARWRQAIAMEARLLADPRFRLPSGQITRITAAQRRFLRTHGALLAQRARANLIRDAHGDLRPEHIWPGPPVTIIDRLEFDAALRALDPLDEVAYLDLECTRLGAAWVGRRIRRRLGPGLGDDPACGLYFFYRSYRALLRARLSIAHLLDATPRTPEKWPPRARAYLRLALADAVALQRCDGARPIRPPSDR